MKDQLEQLVAQMYQSGITYGEGVREFKKRFILHVLAQCKQNQSKAARELGMHRNTLARVIAELKLDFPRRSAGSGERRKPKAEPAFRMLRRNERQGATA